MKACSLCNAVFDDEKSCPKCGVDLSDKFFGLVILINPEKSELSKIIDKNTEGKYAIRVR